MFPDYLSQLSDSEELKQKMHSHKLGEVELEMWQGQGTFTVLPLAPSKSCKLCAYFFQFRYYQAYINHTSKSDMPNLHAIPYINTSVFALPHSRSLTLPHSYTLQPTAYTPTPTVTGRVVVFSLRFFQVMAFPANISSAWSFPAVFFPTMPFPVPFFLRRFFHRLF